MMTAAFVVFLAQGKVLTLAEALQTAQRMQPTVHQAHANTEVARARVGEARAPLLPQIFGTAQYQRKTLNNVPNALAGLGGGSGAMGLNAPPPSWNTADSWNFTITAQQTLWDASGQLARWRQNVVFAEGVEASERATRQQVALNVRTFYFAARGNKALMQVQRENLANQERHLAQIAGFVKVGTRPEIDLAQARTDRANALVALITAENNYEVAKAQLNLAVGLERDTNYDVEDESTPPVEGEEEGVEPLLAEALKARPDYLSLEKQVQAQEIAIWAAKTAYGPNLNASTGFSDGGQFLDKLGWNWNFTLTLNWQLFNGGLTWYTVKEQKASLSALEAQRDLLRQNVRLGVEQTRLAVRAAKASLVAAEEALTNARERLRLAEGRYQAGVGSVIELGDAQVAYTQAGGQKVTAEYNVSTARAQLLLALGRF